MAKKKINRGNKLPSSSILRPEDEALFLDAMNEIGKIPTSIDKTTPAKKITKKVPDKTKSPPKRPLNLDDLPVGGSADVDKRTFDRLRRGRLRPEARLDLHGMTQDQAHKALIKFIEGSQEEGRRCVIVITGRGRVSEGGGVLRREVPGWLNSPRVRPIVLAISLATPRDGGPGAMYVLLRRLRQL